MNCCKVHIPFFFVFKMETPRGRWVILSFLLKYSFKCACLFSVLHSGICIPHCEIYISHCGFYISQCETENLSWSLEE